MIKLLSLIFMALFSLQALAQTKCIAHRGYHHNAPDNSLEAINLADQVGADGIEFDIVHTKDGIALVNHDKVLKKTGMDSLGESCPLDTPISQMTLKEIQSKCTLKDGSAIPTLEDVVESLKYSSAMLFVELKDMPSTHTSAIMKKYYSGREDQLRVIAFGKKDIKGLKSHDNKFWKGVKFLKLTAQPFGIQRSMGVNVFLGAYKTRRKFFKRLKRELSVWTVNKETQLKMLIDDGVNFITTDNIEACMKLTR